MVERIEGTQVWSGVKIDKCRIGRGYLPTRRDDVELGPKRSCLCIQNILIKVWPPSGIQTAHQAFRCGNCLGRAKSAVSGAVNKRLSQEVFVSRF